jgi:hypothetical protein
MVIPSSQLYTSSSSTIMICLRSHICTPRHRTPHYFSVLCVTHNSHRESYDIWLKFSLLSFNSKSITKTINKIAPTRISPTQIYVTVLLLKRWKSLNVLTKAITIPVRSRIMPILRTNAPYLKFFTQLLIHYRYCLLLLSENIYRPSHSFPASLKIGLLLTRLPFN